MRGVNQQATGLSLSRTMPSSPPVSSSTPGSMLASPPPGSGSFSSTLPRQRNDTGSFSLERPQPPSTPVDNGPSRGRNSSAAANTMALRRSVPSQSRWSPDTPSPPSRLRKVLSHFNLRGKGSKGSRGSKGKSVGSGNSSNASASTGDPNSPNAVPPVPPLPGQYRSSASLRGSATAPTRPTLGTTTFVPPGPPPSVALPPPPPFPALGSGSGGSNRSSFGSTTTTRPPRVAGRPPVSMATRGHAAVLLPQGEASASQQRSVTSPTPSPRVRPDSPPPPRFAHLGAFLNPRPAPPTPAVSPFAGPPLSPEQLAFAVAGEAGRPRPASSVYSGEVGYEAEKEEEPSPSLGKRKSYGFVGKQEEREEEE
ncbi:hypothetical protein B0T14DRAFT_594699 [Immersiella caudata]|uniref:Uncharacterized protein n=1 Tax=Immersiella caudata TaxID=314043 RepID=A0AA39U491_9PEZI|nr:hypothetical protein B0T14DRAFT_594699 [Immersiella caudata]